MDAVLQNFRRSFGPTTPFFHSQSLDPRATMEELYRLVDKYSTLEDNIRAASQTVMITAQSSKPSTEGQSEQKGSQSKNQHRSQDQSEIKKKGTPTVYPSEHLLQHTISSHSGSPDFKWPTPIQSDLAQHN